VAKGFVIPGGDVSGSDLFTGTLDLLILRTLEGAALHGYAIGRSIREGSEGVLDVEEGALYPALHRLESRGLLTSKWGKTETGRRAKFYTISGTGRAHLDREAKRWSAYAGAVQAVLTRGEV
jgi:PadR family transcriptional regulator, regulatory protein PadR